MLPSLTKRQKEILDFIKISDEIHGYAPSLDEIKSHFNLSAVSTVHEHIANLEKKGFLTRELNQARSIQVIKNRVTSASIVDVPMIASIKNSKIIKATKPTIIPITSYFIESEQELFAVKVLDDSLLTFRKNTYLILTSPTKTNFDNINLLLIENNKQELFIVQQIADKPRQIFEELSTGKKISNTKNINILGIIVLQISRL